MKYYIYISDTKVDMLFAQIPTNILKKITAELNINLGMVSVSLKERQNEQTRFHKVEVVNNYINEHLEVGDIDNPKTYFKDTVPMMWGTLPVTPEGQGQLRKNFVYFQGGTKQTKFGLGGSAQHIIGQEKCQFYPGGVSITPDILTALKEFDPDLPTLPGDWTREDCTHVTSRATEPDFHLRLISISWPFMGGPPERLEFLAKRLVEGSLELDSKLKHVLLGNPIYVAYAD